jgi:hypothetical protein
MLVKYQPHSELPVGRKAIDAKWIFKVKKDENGKTSRYKARLVIRGCAQRRGLDYEETYAPVARMSTVRILLSVINHKSLVSGQMDVKNAFLQGNLNVEIFMLPPPGVSVKGNLVCKLQKPLYGLKQARKEWNSCFDKFV